MTVASRIVESWQEVLEPHRDPARAEPMAAYMRDQFAFLGIAAPERRRLVRPETRALGPLPETVVLEVVELAWRLPEREYQYTAAEFLAERVAGLSAATAMPFVERLITTQPWWDTVDVLCRHVAGALVLAQPAAGDTVERWLADEDRWLIRSAILHQERWGEAMSWPWIARACEARAAHDDFFVRKAIGWVLRTYAHRGRPQADEVRALLDRVAFSGLTQREALRRVRH